MMIEDLRSRKQQSRRSQLNISPSQQRFGDHFKRREGESRDGWLKLMIEDD